MQTLELIKRQLELANVFLAANRKKRDEALAKLEAAKPGSRERRELYEKNDQAEREYLQSQATVDTLEWVLGEPVQLRWFKFQSRQPFDSLPATGVHDLGAMAFLETTREAQQLLVEERGFQFITSRPDVEYYHRAAEQARAQGQPPAAVCLVENVQEYYQLAGQLSKVSIRIYRPDYTN